MPGTSQGDYLSERRPTMPDAARRLPHDASNTAPATRARFRYQDECIALMMLQHLGSNDLVGIIVEHSTDAILLSDKENPELVSIKHREVDQFEDSGWSWTALNKQGVFTSLYRQWCDAGKSCSLAFWTNAGFVRKMRELRNVLAYGGSPSEPLIKLFCELLKVSRKEARDFLRALSTPPDPMPRRKEITAQGIHQMAQLLQRYRRDAARHAEHCYRTLIDEIATASTDVPEWEARIPPPVTATLTEYLRRRDELEIERRYFDSGDTLDRILREFDARAAHETPSLNHDQWVADTQFVGRMEIMTQLAGLLAPGSPHEVAPVVIHGLTGCGKTSLATQFAADHSDSLRPIFIRAESQSTLLDGLARLTGHKNAAPTDIGITVAGGPVTLSLPENSAILLIIDGVTDASTIRGVIPRQSLCRVLITSTVKHLDQGYVHLELGVWRPEESDQYLRLALPDASDADRNMLAEELHHHPLAVVQAANHCRAMDRPVSQYLHNLAQEPLNTLDVGEASGHPVSAVRAIKLNVESAGERNPMAVRLLNVLAYLSGDPVPLSLFDERLAIGHVTNVVDDPSPQPRRWAKWINRMKRPTGTAEQDVQPHDRDEGFRILNELGQQASRDSAIDVLLKHSLVSIRSGGLVLHPLVALVVRNISGDPRQWLELAFGVIISGGEIRALDEPDRADELLGHLSALALTALDYQFEGNAVHVALNHLARRLAALGQHSYGTDRRPGALYFGRKAVELAEAAANTRGGQFEGLAIMARETLAGIYYWLGDTDLAIHYLEVNLAACNDLHHFGLYLRMLRQLAEINCLRGRRERAEQILDKIERELANAPLDDDMQFAVSQIQAMLLSYLGRNEEAASITEGLLDHPSAREVESTAGTELALRAAIRVARGRQDIASLVRNQDLLLALEERKKKPGRRPDRNLIDAIRGAADAAIYTQDFNRSQELIDRAYAFAVDEFGEDSDVGASVLATRGRLLLGRGEWADARRDLEKSADFYHRNPELSEGYLAAVLIHLAQLEYREGHRRLALELAHEAYDLDLRQYGPDHHETRFDAETIELMESLPPTGFRHH